MKRALKIHQLAPKQMRTSFVLVPYGRYLNVKLQKAENGSVLEFQTDWRRDKFVLIRRAKIAVKTSAFNLLLKSIYGEDATWQSISEQWKAQCIIEGLGSKAFSEDDVLLLDVKPYVKEEYEAELERIRLAEERDKRLEAIKSLTYKHPMVTDI